MEYSVTMLQENTRDKCGADVSFVLECCDGG